MDFTATYLYPVKQKRYTTLIIMNLQKMLDPWMSVEFEIEMFIGLSTEKAALKKHTAV